MLASRRRVEDVPAMPWSNHQTAIDRMPRARCAAACRRIAGLDLRDPAGLRLGARI
jgi:hypothetical protein